MSKLLIIIPLLHVCVAVSGQLTANFFTDKSGGCGPLLININNQTTGASGAATYSWDLGNGNTSAEISPRAVYTQPGSYTIVLTVRDGTQSSTASQTVTVYQPPVAAFSVSATKVCSPTPIQFTSTSTPGSGAIASWLWDFGDGSTVSGGQASIAHSYQAAGIEGVSLTVTDVYGCTATKVDSALLTILPRMQVNFSEDNTVLCTIGSPVQFTNTSTGPGTLSYGWSFGDGGSSVQVSPAYSYPAKGTYTVVLTATSSVGCVVSDTQSNVINVANFKAAFTVPSNVCEGVTTIFGDQSTPTPTSQRWLVDGSVVAVPPSLPIFPPVSYSFPLTGAHTVTQVDFFGACQQTVTQTVNVNGPPVIPPFDAVVQGSCGAPATVDFLDHTPGAVSWNWAFNYNYYISNQVMVSGGPANSTTYDNNGIAFVQLTVTNAAGCIASAIQSVTIEPPVVYITETDNQPEGSCGTPLTKSFACPQMGNLVAWIWNFGDGTTSKSATPTHTFSTPREYNTTLTWTDKNGCTATTNGIPTIIATPLNLSFAANDTVICTNEQISFTVPAQFNAPYVSWTFGDGQQYIYSDGNVVHTYFQPGVYTVELQVTDYAGCFYSLTKTNYIKVLASPVIGLSYSNSCKGDRGDITFNVQVTGADSLTWNFGDGQTQKTDSTVTQLVHHYAASGSYIITVVAGNGTACGATATLGFYVEQKPASFLLSAAGYPGNSNIFLCPNGNLALTINASTGNPQNGYYSIQQAQFQYGDSSFQPGYYGYQEQGDPFGGSYSYDLFGFQPGETRVRAIAPDYYGCPDTSNWVNLVVGGVNAGFEIISDDQCYQQPVVLMDTSKAAAHDPIVSWAWSFGDGGTSSQSGTVSHLYAAPGSYAVQLTVKDSAGCLTTTQSYLEPVAVNGPQAAFNVPAGTVLPQGSTVQFNNISNIYGTTNVTWLWNFGDGPGSTSTAFDPTHVYSIPGTYVVTLTATDAAGGCSSVATLTLVIKVFNTAFGTSVNYVTSGSCPPLLVQFTSLATYYTSITWEFGDGSVVSDVAYPSHVYAQPGKYLVTFTVVGANGQTVVTLDSVTVLAPVAALQAAVPAICVGQADTLHSKSNEGVKQYNWDFGDGTVSTGSDSASVHVYNTAGTYTTKLMVTDSLGCSAVAAASDVISVHPPPEVALTPPQALVCLGSSVTLSAALSGGSSFLWSPPTGLSDPASAAPVASPVISTVYSVLVTDLIGCSNSGTIAVKVVRPDTLTVSPDSVAICPGVPVQLHASGAYNYQWIGVVDGLSATNIAGPLAQPAVSAVYRVVGSDSASCFADTLSVQVTVLVQPTVSAGPDLMVQAETPVTIAAVGSSDVVSWLWTPAVFLSCADCAQPVCTPKDDEQYIVTVTAADGCMASDTVVVKLTCDEAKVRIPDAFTPNGDGHNDRWTILGGISQVDHLVIFDRWGAKVFEENHFYPADPSSGWDGAMGGRPAPAGVYAYFVEMHCPTGGVFSRKGTVVLVR